MEVTKDQYILYISGYVDNDYAYNLYLSADVATVHKYSISYNTQLINAL